MKYSLNAGEWSSVFAVPSGIVDRYIKLAGGNSLRLLLFLLRHGGEEFSDEALRDALGFRETGELEDAALFWVQRGVIRYDAEKTAGDTNAFAPAAAKPVALSSRQLTLDEVNTPAEPAPSAAASSVKKISADSGIYVSGGEIAGRIKNDPQIEFLFDEAQKLYGRALRPRETQMVISLVDHYGIPAMAAVMLLKYCFKIGKTTPNYINAVAKGWSDDEINTVELADARISAMEKQNGVEESLREAMEMKSKFTPEQRRFIGVWTDDWGFSTEMIMMAYDITVNSTGKMSFPYANKILENWNKSGVRTRESAVQLSAAHKQKNTETKAAEQNRPSSFDMDDVMSQIKKQYSTQS